MTFIRIFFVTAFTAFQPLLAHAFFCPTNFNQIDFGATMNQVIQQCGKPDSQETKKGEASVPQEWTYFTPQSMNVGGSTPVAQGSVKTQVTFDASGKVMSIVSNGMAVGSSPICGTNISVGDTQSSVQAACGKPTFISKQDTSATTSLGTPQPADKITVFIYNSNPPVKLTFEKGVLTKKE